MNTNHDTQLLELIYKRKEVALRAHEDGDKEAFLNEFALIRGLFTGTTVGLAYIDHVPSFMSTLHGRTTARHLEVIDNMIYTIQSDLRLPTIGFLSYA